MMREFRKTTGRATRPNVWFAGIDEDDPAVVITRWGLLDGAMQETRDRPGDCGVEGHSDYQTAEDYAKFCLSRDIRKKIESGYVEWVDGAPVGKVASSISFGQTLPKNLTFYKPKTEIDDKKLAKLQANRRAIWTLKRDGMMHVAVRHGGRWEIYSRRMDLATERFPHIVESLDRLSLPDETILLGEIVLLRDDGSDDYKGVSRICRSDPDQALAYQGLGDFPADAKDKTVLGRAGFYAFDVAFHSGVDYASKEKVGVRLTLLRHVFSPLDPSLSLCCGLLADRETHLAESKRRETMLRKHHIGPVKIWHTSHETDLMVAKEMGLEGFVVLDANAVYGDKGYSFDGKAQRPDGIWKRKPVCQDEFIVSGLYVGTGRNMGKLGGFHLQQIHPSTGKRVECGKCGGGFTDEQRELIWEERDEWVGRTVKVEFDSRQEPKNGAWAVRFPVFTGASDKTPEECVAQGFPEED